MANGRAVIGAEKYEFIEARDVLGRLSDAIRRAKDLLKQVGREEQFTVRGDLGAEQKAELFEERDVVALLNDMVFSFRDLMYIVYAQLRKERAGGRSRVYAKFKGLIERELGTLITEIRRLEGEEARI